METELVERLGQIRTALAGPAQDILTAAQQLVETVDTAGSGDATEDLRRGLFAARELDRRIYDLVDLCNEAMAGRREDLIGVGNKLRHDLRNAVAAVRGYFEMLDEDLRDMGDDGHAAALTDLIARTIALEARIGQAVNFTDLVTAGDQTPAMTVYMTDAPLDAEAAIKGRILLVDDDAVSRNVIAARLRRDGHAVTTAESGEQALVTLYNDEFDVMLLDLMMPGLTGFDVMQRMRQSAVLRQVRVIVVSGLDQEENAIRCVSLGAEDYLAKPVNPILLRARIGSCLARKQWRDQERLYLMHLEAEKTKSDALLLNTLPAPVVKRLSSGEKLIADAYENVTVLFSDFANFTSFAASRSAQEVVEVLNRVFTEFDSLALDLGAEKIKTIGDGYLAVSGLPVPRDDHAEVMADMALGMIGSLNGLNARFGTSLEVRVGIHSGPVVAGVIGSHKFAYDIWGHTVNAAARHESYSMPQHIHVSAQAAQLLKGKFDLTSRGVMLLRGIGEVETYFLNSRLPAAVAEVPDLTLAAEAPYAVLIADDDTDMQALVARRMQRHGWTVKVVANGAEAWNELQNGAFDLLITDCEMPLVDGFELARMVRAAEATTGARIGIIAMTGTDCPELAQRCLASGMDAFLRKPVLWVELERGIARVRGQVADIRGVA